MEMLKSKEFFFVHGNAHTSPDPHYEIIRNTAGLHTNWIDGFNRFQNKCLLTWKTKSFSNNE